MILVNGVYTIIDNFTTDSNVVMKEIGDALAKGDKEISAAMGWMYLLVVLLIVGLIAAIFSAYVFYQRRD
jgi:choline-glycine betaine transporter